MQHSQHVLGLSTKRRFHLCIHTHSYTERSIGRQRGVQCLAQGCFDMWPDEASTTRLLKELVIRGQAQRKLIKELSAVAKRSSKWLWIEWKDAEWAAKDHFSHQVTRPGLINLWWAFPSWGCLVINGQNMQWGLDAQPMMYCRGTKWSPSKHPKSKESIPQMINR